MAKPVLGIHLQRDRNSPCHDGTSQSGHSRGGNGDEFAQRGYQFPDAAVVETEGNLDRFLFTRKHLTGYSRLLARHGFRRGLVDHKKTITLSRKRE